MNGAVAVSLFVGVTGVVLAVFFFGVLPGEDGSVQSVPVAKEMPKPQFMSAPPLSKGSKESGPNEEKLKTQNKEAAPPLHQTQPSREKKSKKMALDIIDLTGVWTVSNSNDSIQISGNVPGNMYTALMGADIIEDPYFRFNDEEYRWIHWDSWTYTRTFTVFADQAGRGTFRLVSEGLDTVSTVYINDREVGRSDNQFIKYAFDATSAITAGQNTIRIEFESAVEYAKREFDTHEYRIPPDCPPEEYHPECHANMIRKAQCSFSWDWGPAFATQGPWLPIWLEAYDLASIRDVSPIPFREPGEENWNLRVIAHLDVGASGAGEQVTVRAAIADVGSAELAVTLEEGEQDVSVLLSNLQVDSWWPNGYGDPNLYDLTVSVIGGSGDDTSQTVRTGFRTIELVEDEMDDGLTFFFKINDVPIYMKGSNWIPVDSFLDRVTPERLRSLLEAATFTNMNTIRIWGGGIYEFDDFYSIADELGLLIWQDMMLACSMYPVHDPFLVSVRQEMRSQVRRLQRHPSLVAWTANNENEGALVDNWYGTDGPLYGRYKEDYVTLYIDIIRDEILGEDTSRPFLSSSPTNGKVTEENGWISEDPRPSVPEYGDVHYYNYIDDCLDHNIYPKSRYVSEYGYQSWPLFSTIEKISQPEDWAIDSDFFKHRQHKLEAGDGTDQLIRRHFRWPDTGSSEQDFKDYIFLSQAIQALCYRVQTEFYRRGQSDSSMRNMGALYWQHNDIWQAPSWATIDVDGKWKMAHYYAKDFFADPLVSIIREGNKISAFGVSDLTSDLNDLDLTVTLYRWNEQDPIFNWMQQGVDVPAASSTEIFDLSVDNITAAGCSDLSQCVLTYTLWSGEEAVSPESPFYLSNFIDIDGLTPPNVQVTGVESSGENEFEVTIVSEALSPFTFLEAVDIQGHFSDNGFLVTEPEESIIFYAEDDITAEELQNSITITTLAEVYDRQKQTKIKK